MIMASGNSLLPRDDNDNDDDKIKKRSPSSWMNPHPHNDPQSLPAAAPTPYSQSFFDSTTTSRPIYQINEQDRRGEFGGGEFLQRQWQEQHQIALLQQQQQQHEQLIHQWQQQQQQQQQQPQRGAMTFGALAQAPLMMEPDCYQPGGQPQPRASSANHPSSGANILSSPSIDPELVHDLYRLLQGSAAGSIIPGGQGSSTCNNGGAAGTTASHPTLLHRSFLSPPTTQISSPMPQLQGQAMFPSSFVDNSSFKSHNISSMLLLEDSTMTGRTQPPYVLSQQGGTADAVAVPQHMQSLLSRKSASASNLTNDLLRLRQQQQQQQSSSLFFSAEQPQQQQQQQVVTHHPQPIRPRSSSLPFWNSAGLGVPAGMDSTMNYSWMTTTSPSTTTSLIMDRLQLEPQQWNNDGDAPYIPPPPMTSSSSVTTSKSGGLSLLHRKPILRALSAYNFFFRDERDRIVENNSEGPYDTSLLKKDELLAGHWHRDRSKKRRHRKTHGKIAFTDLSKVISKRWKELPNSVKSFYRDVAADDLVRYHKELEDQKASLRPLHAPSSTTTTTTTTRHQDLY